MSTRHSCPTRSKSIDLEQATCRTLASSHPDPAIGGRGIASFDREAASPVEAIASAIIQGRTAGVEVLGVSSALA